MQKNFAKNNHFLANTPVASFIRNYPLLKPCITRAYLGGFKAYPKSLNTETASGVQVVSVGSFKAYPKSLNTETTFKNRIEASFPFQSLSQKP